MSDRDETRPRAPGMPVHPGDHDLAVARRMANKQRHLRVWQALREEVFSILWERSVAEEDPSAMDPRALAHHWFDMWPTVEAAMGALRKHERTPEAVADLVGDQAP